ncbi:MAG TPA: long-chain fatty acid--CoA ligase [Candidatus Limnocylindria bacterium]
MTAAEIHLGGPLRTPEAERPASLPDLAHRSSLKFADRPALKWRAGSRRDGRWEGITFSQLWQRVQRTALGLRALGIGGGDRVSIISRSRVDWAICDLATMSLGAVSCPIFPAEHPGKMEFMLRNVSARMVLVEDAHQAARVAAVRSRLPALEFVVAFEGEGLPSGTLRLDDVRAAADTSADAVAAWEATWSAVGRDDVATIVHTSGTTGEPKGVVLAHGNILHVYEAGAQAIPFNEEDIGLSVLPLSHMMERSAGMIVPLGVGACIAFAEPIIERWPADLLEVRPTVMVTVPPFFERMHKRILSRIASSPPWKQRAFAWAVGLGHRRYENHLAGRRDAPWLRLQLALANRLVFGPIRAATGGRLRFFASASAPLSREIGELFYAMGILILEGYGLTEAGPLLTLNRQESFRFGSVGEPVAQTEIGVDDETGEVLARGPGIMRGYINRPEETAAAIDADGWLHTGDIGRFDEAGRLFITDRIKNLVILANGKKVMPGPMESALLASRYIAQAVIVGEGREQTGVLVAPNFAELAEWARQQGAGSRDQENLAAMPEAVALIEAEVRTLLRDYPAWERPRRVALLPRLLDDEHDEVTPLGKPKRHVVVRNWPDHIARLYEYAATPAVATL